MVFPKSLILCQPVYQMSVELPSIKGVCQLAADDKLPNKTVLIGTDFGKDNMLSLIHSVKSTPIPVLTVTRAMHAKGELANQVADTFHAIEGAKPPDVTAIAKAIVTLEKIIENNEKINY